MNSPLKQSWFSVNSMGVARAMQVHMLLRVAVAWLVGIGLAKSGMATAEIGRFEILLFLGTTFTFFWVNGLLQALPAFAVHSGENRAFAAAFWVFAILAFLILGVVGLSSDQWVPMLMGMRSIPYLNWFLCYLALSVPAFTVEMVYLTKEKADALFYWAVLTSIGYVAAVLVPVWWGFGLRGAFNCLLFYAILRLLWAYKVTQGKRLGFGLDWTIAQKYLMFALPLMTTSIIGNLVVLFDQWLVAWYFNDERLFAIYRYGARELPLTLALATALGMALVPGIARDAALGIAELKKRTTGLMHTVFPVAILGILFADSLFPILFNPDFSASAPLFALYLLLSCSRILLPNSIFIGLGDTRALIFAGLAELGLKVITGLLFVQWWGLEGLVWSAVGCYFFEKILLGALLWTRHRIPLHTWLDVSIYSIYTFALMVTFLLKIYI